MFGILFARLGAALFPAHEQDAEHDAGWDLFGHHALSQSRVGRRYGRDPAGDGEDALNTDQRLLRQERKDPRGRPDGARDVRVRGQEAVGIQMPASEEGAVSVDFWCGRITRRAIRAQPYSVVCVPRITVAWEEKTPP